MANKVPNSKPASLHGTDVIVKWSKERNVIEPRLPAKPPQVLSNETLEGASYQPTLLAANAGTCTLDY